MSKENVERFAEVVRADKGLQEEVKRVATSPDALVQMAVAHGYDITLDEITAYIQNRKAKLSFEDLEKVAGGKSHHNTTTVAEATQTVVGVTTEAAMAETTTWVAGECVVVAT